MVDNLSSAIKVAASTPSSVSGRRARCLRHSQIANSRSTALSTAALMVDRFSLA